MTPRRGYHRRHFSSGDVATTVPRCRLEAPRSAPKCATRRRVARIDGDSFHASPLRSRHPRFSRGPRSQLGADPRPPVGPARRPLASPCVPVCVHPRSAPSPPHLRQGRSPRPVAAQSGSVSTDRAPAVSTSGRPCLAASRLPGRHRRRGDEHFAPAPRVHACSTGATGQIFTCSTVQNAATSGRVMRGRRMRVQVSRLTKYALCCLAPWHTWIRITKLGSRQRSKKDMRTSYEDARLYAEQLLARP
jgi:hypothetical protein